jgi:hypothetical protein
MGQNLDGGNPLSGLNENDPRMAGRGRNTRESTRTYVPDLPDPKPVYPPMINTLPGDPLSSAHVSIMAGSKQTWEHIISSMLAYPSNHQTILSMMEQMTTGEIREMFLSDRFKGVRDQLSNTNGGNMYSELVQVIIDKRGVIIEP